MMERDEVLRLAREAGFKCDTWNGKGVVISPFEDWELTVELERFAALVAAAELGRARQIVVDGAVSAAVAAEREACLSIAREAKEGAVMSKYATSSECRAARDMAKKIEARIRARTK